MGLKTQRFQNTPAFFQNRPILLLVIAFSANGCGEENPVDLPGQCEEEGVAEELECNGTIVFQSSLGNAHVSDETSPIPYPCSPPASGPHYPRWAVWGESSNPIPREHWVHNLEHGGIGLLYRCDDGCEEWVAQLRQEMESQPIDLSCSGGVSSRIFLTEDTLLPRSPMIAAVAWEYVYTADCVAPESLRRFVDDHYGNGPESTCAQGTFSPDI